MPWSSTRRWSWRVRSAPRTPSNSSTACWMRSGRSWTRRADMSISLEEQIHQRRANLADLKALGIDVYPRAFARTHTIAALVDAYGQRTHDELEAERIETVTSGRILGIRAFGKANFLVLSDGHARVQVYVRQDSLPELDFRIFKLLDFGDWVGVEGRLFRTKTNEFTIWASRLHFLAKCLLPLPEKWHGLTDIEIRYRQRYLDLIVNPDSRRVFEARSRIVSAIREFMTARGYLEVETPMMQPIAGGALARPFVTDAQLRDRAEVAALAGQLGLDVAAGHGAGKITMSIFEAFCEDSLVQPTFVYDFPTEVSPLSKQKPDDPDTVERFELYIGGFEVANAFSELNDPAEQRRRFEAQLKDRARGDLEAHAMDDDYIRALEYGLPPTGGEGVGIDRLVMLLTNSLSIRHLLLFPLMRKRE